MKRCGRAEQSAPPIVGASRSGDPPDRRASFGDAPGGTFMPARPRRRVSPPAPADRRASEFKPRGLAQSVYVRSVQRASVLEPASVRLAIVAAHLGIPLGNGLTPLVLFWQPGKRHRAVREHCAAAFDFQMTYVCSILVSMIALLFVASATQSNLPIILVVVGIVGGGLLLLFFGIRAAIDGWRGEPARNPPSVRLLRREVSSAD